MKQKVHTTDTDRNESRNLQGGKCKSRPMRFYCPFKQLYPYPTPLSQATTYEYAYRPLCGQVRSLHNFISVPLMGIKLRKHGVFNYKINGRIRELTPDNRNKK